MNNRYVFEDQGTTSYAQAGGKRGLSLPDGGSIIFHPPFPVPPLVRIIADPLWALLSKKDQREVRQLHAAALQAARLKLGLR
jgi:hypothetical protein